ncbi:MAG: prepilin-type N-terminal cleavage/methylation domain-containing protein, partial [Candidatus Tectomicrobia bacterium]|nr:prepilin-type N-terminal cleavage/methylation domain-containing protein [Candidatus Tectomicrobia bacterium]
MNRVITFFGFPDRSNHGLTLIELMVALTISAILLVSIFSLFMSQQSAYRLQDQIAAMDQNARIGMEVMLREIRLAGYPTGGVLTAEANQFSFQGDMDGDGTAETITYALDNAEHQLTRKSGGGGAQPVSEQIITDGLQFSYFDQDNNPLTAPVPEDRRSSIARVDVALTAQTEKPDPAYKENGGYRRIALTGSVRIRNLAVSTGSGGTTARCPTPAAPSNFRVIGGLDSTLACTIRFQWDSVSTGSDGAALTAGCSALDYKLYYGTASGNYANNVLVGRSTNYDLNTTPLPACSYFGAVSGLNLAGEGAKSSESSITDETAPNSPTGL